MSSKRIEPASFKPETTAPSQPVDRPKRNRPALAGLALIALIGLYAVFIWLPEQVSNQDYPVTFDTQTTEQTVSPIALESTGKAAAQSELSPFEQAQLEQARKAAQDILEQLLLEQNALLDVEVNRWAEQDYQAAIADAKKGDQFYRGRDFDAAISAYTKAHTMLTDLTASIPNRVESLVASILLNLEDFQREPAEFQLELLAVMAPDHAQLLELQQRVNDNDKARELMDSAKAAAAETLWQEAKARISDAVMLDPQHQTIATQAAQIETEWQSWRFQTALSDVYRAIAQSNFKAAENALNNAAKYQGDALAIEQAKTQLEQTRSTYRLGELAELAQSAVDREDWHLAKQYYEAALKIDPAVQYALSGLPRAQTRAELQEKLEAVIAQPNRLEDIKVAQATEALVQNASAQPAPRNKLERQIESIRKLLKSANQEIPVILTSDGLTELTIVRHMRLGTIERFETRLRPGEYTFRGTRVGYRDTLKTVRVAPNSATMNLHIVCTETI